MTTRRPGPTPIAPSAFAGFCFPPDVIVLAVRWYLRFALSYRDVEELLSERGIQVDHVTIYRWVLRFTPLLAEAARPCRHAVGGRWWVDETYVKVAGRWGYVYRAIDQFGQLIDVFVSPRRDAAAARRFFERTIGTTNVTPVEVVTDQAATYPIVLEELLPAAWHRTDRYANNRVEADHGRLKARLGPMRGLKQDRSARIVIAGHAFVQAAPPSLRGSPAIPTRSRLSVVTCTNGPWTASADPRRPYPSRPVPRSRASGGGKVEGKRRRRLASSSVPTWSADAMPAAALWTGRSHDPIGHQPCWSSWWGGCRWSWGPSRGSWAGCQQPG
jgi:transposase-like protein